MTFFQEVFLELFCLCLFFQDVMLIYLDFFLGFIQIKFILKNKKYLFLNNIASVFGLA
jgi:hypothetical protein